MTSRPVIYVLAGVNGAGKSSIGGQLLKQAGATWFKPDSFARELVHRGWSKDTANGAAWQEGLRRLESAISEERSFAFETTLGGRTISDKLKDASASHDVLVWFCGLDSPELHIQRIRVRVATGGHDIPEQKVRERYVSSLANLIGLMPHLVGLRVFDNSVSLAVGSNLVMPALVLEMAFVKTVWPMDSEDLRRTPAWAKPLVEAALRCGPAPTLDQV